MSLPIYHVPMRTKWEILEERRDKARRAYESLQAELDGLDRTPCRMLGHEGYEFLSCSTCGTEFKTEGDFARHYLIDDERYLNLGHCPNKKV